MTYWLMLISTLVLGPVWVNTLCNRYPTNSGVEKSPVDENFAILIKNNPQNYILGQEYNVTLNAYNGHRFIAFSLALENENGDSYTVEDLGRLEVIDSVETRYSPSCGNMIESTNTNSKAHIVVTWVAPTNPESGCVLIRATVLQHRDVWHMDDGALTRRICQEVVDEVESRGSGRECCACDEARYEITFQGNWNRNLHPKDFPPKGWTARFGDIIGAAHTADYRFWGDGLLASEGMQEYAEYGSTTALEREFNDNFKEGIIRTIIKSRGPAFPNLNGISVASVRVDPSHHLISLASKIDPSPDWFVGISGMELCMANCTWLEERVVQLYPWDAGTDAGPSYLSPDQPQKPPDVVRRMRSNFPNDPRSPFYDETGAAMYPMATLVVKRQRIYERSCENKDSNNVDIPRECYTHPWTPWTECSAKCGDGHSTRVRVFKQPELASIYKCAEMIDLRQNRMCKGENCFGSDAQMIEGNVPMGNPAYGSHQNMAECDLGPWSEWSECSKTCGEGTSFRRRQFRNRQSQEACLSATTAKIFESRKCQGKLCFGDLNGKRQYGLNSNADFDDEENNNLYENTAQDFNSYSNNRNFNSGRLNELWNNNPQDSYDKNEPQYRGGAYGYNKYYEDKEEENEIADNAPNNQQHWNTNNRAGQQNRDGRYANSRFQGNGVGDFEIETPDLLENNQVEFEVGNLRREYTDNQIRGKNTYRGPPYMNNFNKKNDFKAEMEPILLAPGYCFHKLDTFHCLDPTVVGNFWFFNYCQNECMLYAAHRCDKNENKFTSLEACEQKCQRPENEAYLKQQQSKTCSPRERGRVIKHRKNKNW